MHACTHTRESSGTPKHPTKCSAASLRGWRRLLPCSTGRTGVRSCRLPFPDSALLFDASGATHGDRLVGFLVARAAVWRHCAGTPHRCLPLGWARRDFRSTDCAATMVGNRLRPETLAPVACSSPLGHPTTPFQHPTTPFQLVVGAHSVSCAHRVPPRHGATLAHTLLLCIRCRAPFVCPSTA